jgi:hypothetical protein
VTTRLSERRLAIAATVALAVACASAPRNEASIQAGSAARILLVLPLNVAIPISDGLGDQSLAVWQELESYLQSQGKQLKTVSYRDARRLWLASIARARRAAEGGKADYATASRFFVRELRRHAEFDAVIAPSIFVQQANFTGTRASWDGVTRTIEIRRDNRDILRPALSGSRTARAASLHVVVFDAEGKKLQEGQGGLELLVRARADEGFGQIVDNHFWLFEERPDYFDDNDHLREGIAHALAPFLPEPPRADEQ